MPQELDPAPETELQGELEALIESLQSFASQDPQSTTSSSSQDSSIEDQRASAQDLADELLALKSIYEDISLFNLSSNSQSRRSQTSTTPPEPWNPNSRIRLCLNVELDSLTDSHDSDSDHIKLSITIPPHYPNSTSPPQFQLLSRYIGSRQVDSDLFGQILRLFLHDDSNLDEVHWSKGQVVLFEGIEKTREKVESWLKEKNITKNDYKVYDEVNLDGSSRNGNGIVKGENGKTTIFHGEEEDEDLTRRLKETSIREANHNVERLKKERKRIERLLVTAPSISERKSTFIGHAAFLESLEDVQLIISHLQSDRRLSKASHPTIYAFVFKGEGGVIHRDNDDDGESAAGGRLSHLLDILNLENVLVVVTRFFGGVHLGPDRFKFINQAARNALEVLGAPLNETTNAKGDASSSKNSKKSK